ncbi:hypothetical protein [Kordia sp.]|uniref:hypothetical protein n=1 Tax=Kordia sp. TaxID=1965332 RepID=UPI003D29BEE8
MKKKKISKQLRLIKKQIAPLNSSVVHGGRPPKSYDCRTQYTLYFKCSDVNCYTEVTCYHTETCQVPVTGLGCETSPPNC